MTEAEWLTAMDPMPMLAFIRDKASARKLRLSAVWCCRTLHHLLVPAALELISVAERVAEGSAGSDERKRARQAAFELPWLKDLSTAHRRGPAKSAVGEALSRRAWEAAESTARISIGLRGIETGLARGWGWSSEEARDIHRTEVTEVLRDIFGNPFRPVPFSLEWRTDTAIALARQMYEAREFSAMPILADALQDAGCDNPDILDHCRGAGPHVRGCWVVDRVLGKE